MRRRRGSLVIAAAAAVAAFAAPALPASASRPGGSALTAVHSTATWSGGPLTGTAPVAREASCQAQACDDHVLELSPPPGTDDVLTIVVRSDAASSVALAVFDPTCAPGPTSTCYVGYGPDTGLAEVRASIHPVLRGQYVVRVACGRCISATYAASASLEPASDAAAPTPPTNLRFQVEPLTAPSPSSTGASSPLGEPGVHFNGNGLGVINTFGPTVWTTRDGGRHWSGANGQVDPTAAAAPCSVDSDAVAANDGTLYVLNLCQPAPGMPPQVFLYGSDDGGQSWNRTGAGLPVAAGIDADRPWVTADPTHPRTLYVTYHSYGSGTQADDTSIYVLRSSDGGRTFSRLSNVSLAAPGSLPDNAVGGNVATRLLVDPRDSQRLYIAWVGASATQGVQPPPMPSPDTGFTRVLLAASDDGGASWSVHTVADEGESTVGHKFPVAAVDSAGTVYIAWSDRAARGFDTHVKLVASRDHGGHWAPPQVIDALAGSNVYPALAAAGPGQVALTWYASRAHDYSDYGAVWSVMFAQVVSADTASPRITRARVSDVAYAQGICMVSLPTCEAANLNPTDLFDFLAVSVDPQGLAHPVWTDLAHGAKRIVTARQESAPFAAAAAVTVTPPGLPPGVQEAAAALPLTSADSPATPAVLGALVALLAILLVAVGKSTLSPR